MNGKEEEIVRVRSAAFRQNNDHQGSMDFSLYFCLYLTPNPSLRLIPVLSGEFVWKVGNLSHSLTHLISLSFEPQGKRRGPG